MGVITDQTKYDADILIAAGKIEFKDGKFQKVDGITRTVIPPIKSPSNPQDPIQIEWNNSKFIEKETKIDIDWNNIEMFGNDYNGNVEVDGKDTGALINTSIDEDGNLVGHYTNGSSKFLAAIPVILFKDPSELQNEFGTVFSDNIKSGKPEYVLAGSKGAGKIISQSIEGSNVDSTKAMTELMVQQRFYSYNAKAYGMMNGMENELLNVIRV